MAAETTGQIAQVRTEDLHDSPYQPRQEYDAEALRELADSIRANGVLAPLLVRPRPAGGYELIGGHRRTRAARLANIATVPCVVRECSDEEAQQIALLDNLAREDLSPWEEGTAYARLVDTGMSPAVIAQRSGRSVDTVTSRMNIARAVGEKARQAFRAGEVGVAHLQALADLPDEVRYGRECPACAGANGPEAVECWCGQDLSRTVAYPWGNPQAVALGKLEHWLAEHGGEVGSYTPEQRAAALAQATVAARIVQRVIETLEGRE